MKSSLLLVLLMLGMAQSQAQEDITQTIRGRIVDKDSHMSLPGANISLAQDNNILYGAATDQDGYFRIEKVKVGRYLASISMLGYQPMARDIIVASGKELVLNFQVETSVETLEGVDIVATKDGETRNKMALISTRPFSVEESNRYAGSRGDPARMASNFAGCLGVDDSRNDIIIRGNSPLSMIYMVEGIEIANPNHFGVPGTAGGSVSILNNKVLSNSDFFTGAFPAAYGNSTAGIMDISLRNGNNEKFEFTGQLAFLGTELTAEGPISKSKRSSFIFNYRYSTFGLFNLFGISLGTSAVPKYQDYSAKLNFPLKNNANLSLFSIAGTSSIDIMISEQSVDEIDMYGVSDRDQHFNTSMGTAGATYSKTFNETTYAKITVAGVADQQKSHHLKIFRAIDGDGLFEIEDDYYVIDSIKDYHDFTFLTKRIAAHAFINKKISNKHIINTGVNSNTYFFDLKDSINNTFAAENDWTYRWDYEGNATLLRPYIQWKYKVSDKLVLNTGLHAQYFTLNGSFSGIEPRVGAKWRISQNQSISAGFGMHSQIQPLYTYFYQKYKVNGEFIHHNINLDFTHSTHYILGYDRYIGKNSKIKIETYYQALSDIPVKPTASSYSLVNMGSGYQRFFPDSLVNEGTGRNYGVEFTLEKYFSNQYFYMITASLYESKYTGSDNVERDTDYNGNFAVNLLGTKEFKTGDKTNLSIGAKITYAGNKRYGLVDTTATLALGDVVYKDEDRNSKQFDNYFRADLKINFTISGEKLSHEIGLDIVNILDNKNVLKTTYGPDPENPQQSVFSEAPQLGRLPLFYYRVDF